jgi:alkanesulfonate monooxygenase SsuD/methylene tetrahydromethanopterin reductase-like flavin-dependent oxidoreductase (luciferase family)
VFRARWTVVKKYAEAAGRDPTSLKSCLYYNLNVGSDMDRAYDESKQFLEAYYGIKCDKRFVDAWTAYGPVESCVAKLQAYADAGLDLITIRLTSWDQQTQYRLYTDKILPALGSRVEVADPGHSQA